MTVLGRKGLLGLTLRVARAAHSASKGSDPTVPDEFVVAVPTMKLVEAVPPVPLDVVQEELMGSLAVPTET